MADDDPYRKRLEAIARSADSTPKGKALRAEVEKRLLNYNASLIYNRMLDKPYLIPGDFSEGGWVYRDNPKDIFVTVPSRNRPKDSADLAEFVAHEAMHQYRNMTGQSEEKRPGFMTNGPVSRDAIGHPDRADLNNLRRILRSQKTFEVPTNYYSPEETYATYAGIEGRLPIGTAITSQPEFQEIANNQALKNLLFSETGGGIWEGQVPPMEKREPPPKPMLRRLVESLTMELSPQETIAEKIMRMIVK